MITGEFKAFGETVFIGNKLHPCEFMTCTW